jgi:hypothetical protein
LICLLKTQLPNERKGSILRQDEDTNSRAEEKLDDVGDRLETTPAKSLV